MPDVGDDVRVTKAVRTEAVRTKATTIRIGSGFADDKPLTTDNTARPIDRREAIPSNDPPGRAGEGSEAINTPTGHTGDSSTSTEDTVAAEAVTSADLAP